MPLAPRQAQDEHLDARRREGARRIRELLLGTTVPESARDQRDAGSFAFHGSKDAPVGGAAARGTRRAGRGTS